MRFRGSLWMALLLIACGYTDPVYDVGPPDTSGDAGWDSGGRFRSWFFPGGPSPDGEGVCCPCQYPTCNCFVTGSGFAEDPSLCDLSSGVCDGEPENFRQVEDEHGCTRFEWDPLNSEPISCFDR